MNLMDFDKTNHYEIATTKYNKVQTVCIMMTSSNGNISALLAICAGTSPVRGEFPAQRPVGRSFDVLFDLRLNKQLSKQSWCWRFETLSRLLWRHRDDYFGMYSTTVYIAALLACFGCFLNCIIEAEWTWFVNVLPPNVSIYNRTDIYI